MSIVFEPIGVVRTQAATLPRHWTVSDVDGVLEIDPRYERGLQDIKPGQRIVVLFNFNQSKPFDLDRLVQTPPHRDRAYGVFSICSPHRPNAIGFSVVTVTAVDGTNIAVHGIDMLDGTPILDIKPHIEGASDNHPPR